MRDGSIGSAIYGRIAPDANGNPGGLNRRNVALGVTVGWNAMIVDGMCWKGEERPVRRATIRERVEINQRFEVNWASVVHRSSDYLWHITEGFYDTASLRSQKSSQYRRVYQKETTLPKRRCPRRRKPTRDNGAKVRGKPYDAPTTKPWPCVKTMLCDSQSLFSPPLDCVRKLICGMIGKVQFAKGIQ